MSGHPAWTCTRIAPLWAEFAVHSAPQTLPITQGLPTAEDGVALVAGEDGAGALGAACPGTARFPAPETVQAAGPSRSADALRENKLYLVKEERLTYSADISRPYL